MGLQCEQRELTIVITLRHDLLYFVGVSYRFPPSVSGGYTRFNYYEAQGVQDAVALEFFETIRMS